MKDTPREKLVEAVRGTLAGRAFVDPAVAGKLISQVASRQEQPGSVLAERLTGREAEVLRLLARGQSNAEIAVALHLSEGTVRNHVSALLSKLEVPDRTQAAILAIRHGLVRLSGQPDHLLPQDWLPVSGGGAAGSVGTGCTGQVPIRRR